MEHSHEATLRAGSETVDITPDDPVEMSGYGAREGFSTGTHDPLLASALVLDDGAVTVGLVSVDVLNVSRELTRRVERTLAESGIELDELLIAATHTHAGPYLPARALDISPSLRAHTDVSGTVADIEARIVSALTAAYERREPATIRTGQATERDVPGNRRRQGGVGGNVRLPSGSIDPDVTALLIETETGARTILYNFACHPVCTTGAETLLSADWPGYTRRTIQAEYGDVPVLFLNGAAADINPAGMDPDRSGEAVYDYMEQVGTAVGERVLDALEEATATDGGLRRTPIVTDSRDLRLPVKSTPPAEWIREEIADLETRIEDTNDDTARKTLTFDKRYAEELRAIAEWDVTCLPNRVPYLEIGHIGILGMPGEVFVRHGLDLKDEARVSTLIPAGYVNDYVGYVPTLAELEHIGYEVRTTKIAPEAIVEFRGAATDLVR